MHLHSGKVDIERAHRRAATGRPDATPGAAALIAQRKADPHDVVELQRMLGNAAVMQLLHDDEAAADSHSPVLDVVGRGGGQPLDQPVKAGMERALGADLSDVRVHTDGSAAASAQAVQAHAYTVGSDIVFGPGQFQPESPTGQRTLAHELTHVVQQRNGPVSGTPTGDGISVSDPSDTYERAAEANADRIVSSGHSDTQGGDGGGGHSSVQREAGAGEEEEVQGLWVQREDKKPEEEEEPVQGLWVQREDKKPEEEEEPVQGLWVQREDKKPGEEDEEPVQGMWVQRDEQKPEEEEPATA
jgi:hypothetical protein